MSSYSQDQQTKMPQSQALKKRPVEFQDLPEDVMRLIAEVIKSWPQGIGIKMTDHFKQLRVETKL